MNQERMKSNLEMIYADDMVKRIRWDNERDGEIVVSADLHELTSQDAMRLVKNVIAILYPVPAFRFEVIHGYKHGTAIKDSLWRSVISPRVISISSPSWNPGKSILEIA